MALKARDNLKTVVEILLDEGEYSKYAKYLTIYSGRFYKKDIGPWELESIFKRLSMENCLKNWNSKKTLTEPRVKLELDYTTLRRFLEMLINNEQEVLPVNIPSKDWRLEISDELGRAHIFYKGDQVFTFYHANTSLIYKYFEYLWNNHNRIVPFRELSKIYDRYFDRRFSDRPINEGPINTRIRGSMKKLNTRIKEKGIKNIKISFLNGIKLTIKE